MTKKIFRHKQPKEKQSVVAHRSRTPSIHHDDVSVREGSGSQIKDTIHQASVRVAACGLRAFTVRKREQCVPSACWLLLAPCVVQDPSGKVRIGAGTSSHLSSHNQNSPRQVLRSRSQVIPDSAKLTVTIVTTLATIPSSQRYAAFVLFVC